MNVKRIVANIAVSNTADALLFYRDILGLEIAMNLGWVVTLSSPETMSPQLSVATEGGSGTPVPHLSIEVDDIDEAQRRVRKADLTFEYAARLGFGLAEAGAVMVKEVEA